MDVYLIAVFYSAYIIYPLSWISNKVCKYCENDKHEELAAILFRKLSLRFVQIKSLRSSVQHRSARNLKCNSIFRIRSQTQTTIFIDSL